MWRGALVAALKKGDDQAMSTSGYEHGQKPEDRCMEQVW